MFTDLAVRADQVQPFDSMYALTDQDRIVSVTALGVRNEDGEVTIFTRHGDHTYRPDEILEISREA